MSKKIICPKINSGKVVTHQDVDKIFKHMMGWNFKLMDSDKDFLWHCTFKKLNKYRDELLKFEKKVLKQYFLKTKAIMTGKKLIIYIKK